MTALAQAYGWDEMQSIPTLENARLHIVLMSFGNDIMLKVVSSFGGGWISAIQLYNTIAN